MRTMLSAALVGSLLLGVVRAAGGATWTCRVRTEGVLGAGGGYVAVAGCDGVGTYTTGGDPVGDGSLAQTGTALCGSQARRPEGVWPTLAFKADGKALLLLYNRTAGKFVAYTASATPGPGAAFEEVATGTDLGASIATVAICR